MFGERFLYLGASNPNPCRVVPTIGEIEPIVLAHAAPEIPVRDLPEAKRIETQNRLDELAKKAGLKPRKRD